MNFNISSPGKLLITSEYFVLKGAQALAIPTKFKQSLDFIHDESKILFWESLDNKNNIWIKCEFEVDSFNILKYKNKHTIALQSLLRSAKKLNPNFLTKGSGGAVTTKLDFPTNWGLGTSSTLINNIAKWARINPYKLLWSNFKGSGYDVACADSKSPILYRFDNGMPIVESVKFNPSFSKNLFFIYLNKKQDSNKEIDDFYNLKINSSSIKIISDLTKRFLNCQTLNEFQNCIIEHEKIVSKSINKQLVKFKYFQDYSGEIKSLGAWGGDFILAAGPSNSKEYFNGKGYNTVFSFNEIF